jgi:hypothetical protein
MLPETPVKGELVVLGFLCRSSLVVRMKGEGEKGEKRRRDYRTEIREQANLIDVDGKSVSVDRDME